MNEDVSHNPYVPEDEPHPENPRSEEAGSHESESPINKGDLDIDAAGPPPSGKPIEVDDNPADKPPVSVLPVIPPEPADVVSQDDQQAQAELGEVPTRIYTQPNSYPPPPPIIPAAVPEEPSGALPGELKTEGTDKTARVLAGVGTAIAVLVLILILAGFPSHKVNTSDLSNDAVTGSKIAPGAVTPDNLQPGAIHAGPTGATGATGAAGAVGATGPRGATATTKLQTNYVEAESSLNTLSPKTVIASCPQGQTLAAGGARIVGASDVVTNVVLQSSGPTAKASSSWSATATTIPTSSSPQPVPGAYKLVVEASCTSQTVSTSPLPPSSDTSNNSPAG